MGIAEEAWVGMPVFVNYDKKPHRQIIVSFGSEENIAQFVKFTGLLLTPQTRSIWFPPEEPLSTMEHAYVNESAEGNTDGGD